MAADTAPTEEREPPRLRRRWLVNLALLAVVAGLLAFYFYYRSRGPAEPGPPLTAIAPETVTRVHIEHPGQPAILLEKRDAQWRLMEPLQARANPYTVENLLRIAAARSELNLDDTDPERYGLQPPQAILKLGDESIEFGTLHPFRPQVYVRYRGAVHLVAATTLSAVMRAPNGFIDGRLIEPERRIVGLRLPGFALTLKDGRWLRQPPDKNLPSDRLSDFVAQWTNAQALSVEPAGSRPALATIQLALQHADSRPETLALDVLEYKPTFVLRRRDEKLEYRFPEDVGKQMLEIGEK